MRHLSKGAAELASCRCILISMSHLGVKGIKKIRHSVCCLVEVQQTISLVARKQFWAMWKLEKKNALEN